MSVFTASDKTDSFGLPHLSANTDASATQYTIIIMERIAHLPDTATHSNVLNGTRIGGLSYKKLSNIATQAFYSVGVRTNDHTFGDVQGTRSSNLCFAIHNVLNYTEPTNANV
jgi:hypothetical protein